MKRKHLLFLITAFLTMGIFVSCDHFLDEIPDNRAELNTKDKITKLLVSAYPDINHCLITEMASDNADQVSGTWTSFNLLQEQAYLWKDITEADVDSPMELWNACYKCIAVANQALLVIEQEDYTGMQAQIGEALLCRAYAHFILVNVFGKHYTKENGDSDPGIPYMERTETEVAPQYERMSVAGVYEKIDADIEKGLPLISDEIYSVTKYHFNRKAAYAFATRFNLYYGNYDKVIEYATQVLTGNPESVLRNWAAEGELDDNRNIRGDAFISADNRANLLLISSFSAWGRIHGPFHLGEKYVHNNKIAYDETCKASATWGSSANLYYDIPSYQGTPKVVMRKLNEYFEVSDPVNGIGSPHIVLPVFTTDETLLCRAEAYVMKKEYENAVKDLATWQSAFTRNKSLTRATINNLYAGMAYYRPDAPTLQNTPKKALHPSFAVEAGEQENFIHCILYMRRVLTLHEGLRWFDIKRYGIEIYRRTVYDDGSVLITDRLLRDDNRRAIQLPQEVINAGLKANPR